jgi:hypothetical protein
MTNPDIDPTVAAPADIPPMSSEEAAEIVRNDEALQAADHTAGDDDAATDDDARTSDSAQTGETA